MIPSQNPRKPAEHTQRCEMTSANESELSANQQADLDDAATQEAYRKQYLAQLRQQQCPGCGESELF